MDTVPSGQVAPQGWPAHWLRASSPPASHHIILIPKLQKVPVPECGVRGLLSEGPKCGQSPIAILPWGRTGRGTGTRPLSVHRGGLSQAPAARAPRTFLGSHGAGRLGGGRLTSSKQCGGPAPGACGTAASGPDGQRHEWRSWQVTRPSGWGWGPVRRGGLLRGRGPSAGPCAPA